MWRAVQRSYLHRLLMTDVGIETSTGLESSYR
ncbi:MAG: hypothetical protein ACI9SB_000638 [Candidatus Azotimanducaceae bacterium]|jgi:hypothetical protein